MVDRSVPGPDVLTLPAASVAWLREGPERVGREGRRTGRASRRAAAGAAERRAPELVAACVRGDPAARSQFVRQYDALVRFSIVTVLRRSGVSLGPEDMADLHQTVMASYFDDGCRRLRLYEGRNRASFATFLRVCATRQTLDYLRRRRRALASGEQWEGSTDESPIEQADPGSGPEGFAAAREELDLVRRALEALSPRERLLVRLHFVEGLETPELARALGTTENAALVLKSRIRQKLRRAIEEPHS